MCCIHRSSVLVQALVCQWRLALTVMGLLFVAVVVVDAGCKAAVAVAVAVAADVAVAVDVAVAAAAVSFEQQALLQEVHFEWLSGDLLSQLQDLALEDQIVAEVAQGQFLSLLIVSCV